MGGGPGGEARRGEGERLKKRIREREEGEAERGNDGEEKGDRGRNKGERNKRA